MRSTAAAMFGSWNGSVSDRSRGWRKEFTSSANVKRLRFMNSTMQGSPQISGQRISAAESPHGSASIQRFFKCKERRFEIAASSVGGFKPPLPEAEVSGQG